MTSAATMTRDQSMLVALIWDGCLTAKRLISANCADVPVRGASRHHGFHRQAARQAHEAFRLLGSSNTNECEAARSQIDELLAKNKKNWNDLTELLSTGNAHGWQDDDDPGGKTRRINTS
jgi:hypothetical protein